MISSTDGVAATELTMLNLEIQDQVPKTGSAEKLENKVLHQLVYRAESNEKVQVVQW